MSQAQERDDLQLSDYTGTLRRRWWLILLCAAVGLVGAVGYYKTAHKEYIATATVYVTGSSSTANEVANGRTSGTVNLDTEAQVVQSAAVAQGAAKLMHATVPLQQLINRVSVTVPANSQVLSISCQESSANGAATCAQSFAQAFLTYSSTTTIASANQQISALQAKIADLQSSSAKLSVEVASLPDNSPQRATAQQQLSSDNSQLGSLNNQVAQLTAELTNPSAGSILSAATPPSSASSPKKLIILPSGLLLGLLVGLVLAFVLDRRDRRIRGPRDLAGIDVPVLMNSPLTRSAADVAIVAPRSPLGREFTGLTHVLTGSLGTGSHVILVTGARPGHGASMVAANLAVALSRNQPDVTLICADLEDSVIPAMVGLPHGPGLTDLLAGDAKPGDAGEPVAVAPRLRVIRPGVAVGTDAEDMQQDDVERLLAKLRTYARWIVLEAPSFLSGPDAYTLAQSADTVVLVVEMPRTSRQHVQSAVQDLHRIGANVLGAALLPAPKAQAQRYALEPTESVPVTPDEQRQPAGEDREELNGRAVTPQYGDDENDTDHTLVIDWPGAEADGNSSSLPGR